VIKKFSRIIGQDDIVRVKGKVPSKVRHQGINNGEHASDHLPS
jgi:hypothetical protein